MGTSLNLQVALGTLVGGALVAAVGVRGALAFDALSFALSAAPLVGLPPLRSASTETTAGFLSVGREGLAFAWRTRVVRTFLIVLFLGVAFAALDNVALGSSCARPSAAGRWPSGWCRPPSAPA